MSRTRENWGGRAGLLGGVLLWAISLPVLALSLQANEAAGVYGRQGVASEALSRLIVRLHVAAVSWSLLFVALQLASLLVLAFALRAGYKLRSAVCFTVAAGIPMLLDAAALLGLLAWLGLTLGVR